MSAAQELKRRPLETVRLLKKAIEVSKELEAVEGDNPQVVAIRKAAKAERELAEAVIAALGGDFIALRMYGRD